MLGRFRLDMRKYFFTGRAVKHYNKILGKELSLQPWKDSDVWMLGGGLIDKEKALG